MNTGLLVCDRCLDDLTWQRSLLVLPPDPPIVFNTRPEPYAVDESNYLVTQDGDNFQTVGGETYITSMPNPADNADTSVLILSAVLQTTLTALTVAYLDLFDGNPQQGGTSILLAVTGSATRTDVAPDLEVNGQDVAVNPEVISITSSSANTVNITHAAIYDAASGGTLLASNSIGATYPTIISGAAVRFDQLGLQIGLIS